MDKLIKMVHREESQAAIMDECQDVYTVWCTRSCSDKNTLVAFYGSSFELRLTLYEEVHVHHSKGFEPVHSLAMSDRSLWLTSHLCDAYQVLNFATFCHVLLSCLTFRLIKKLHHGILKKSTCEFNIKHILAEQKIHLQDTKK